MRRAEHAEFALGCLRIGAVEAAVDADEVHVVDVGVPPDARLLVAAAVAGVGPVVAEDFVDWPLPAWRLDLRPAGAVVGAEIMIVPNRKHPQAGDERAVLGARLAAVIAVVVHVHHAGVVDVDIVAELKQRIRLGRGDGVPDVLMLRHKPGAAAEGEAEPTGLAAFAEGHELLVGRPVFLAVDGDSVSVLRSRLEIFQDHLGHKVVLAPGLHLRGNFSAGHRRDGIGLHLHGGGIGGAQPDGRAGAAQVADHWPVHRRFAVLPDQPPDQRPLADGVQAVVRAADDAPDRQAKLERLLDTRLRGVRLAKRALRHGEHVPRLGIPRQFLLHNREEFHRCLRLAGADQVERLLVDALVLFEIRLGDFLRLVLGGNRQRRERNRGGHEQSCCRSHVAGQCAEGPLRRQKKSAPGQAENRLTARRCLLRSAAVSFQGTQFFGYFGGWYWFTSLRRLRVLGIC